MANLVRDEKHGYLRIAERPDGEALEALYSDYFYQEEKPTYLTKTLEEFDYWEALFGLRLKRIEQERGGPGRLLDIGAGGGFFLEAARRRGWEVAGVEPSRQAVAFAAEHFGIEIFRGFLEELPAPGAPFDAIHTALVLEHVADPERFIETALALLRPGGLLWVEVPNDFNPLQEAIVATLEKPCWWIAPGHHLNYFDFDSLARLLTAHGCEEIDRLASFPMEFFPLMGLDYIGDDAAGKAAHRQRMTFERRLLDHDPATLLRLYRALAGAGMGRTCNLLVRKKEG